MSRVRTGESVLARGVRVIESFGVGDVSLTVSDIARRSGLHVATASRLIHELVGFGWLERDGRRVRIGVRLWEVASRASSTVGLREAAMPFMEDLHAVVGQHTQLAVLEADEVLFVERLTAPGAAVNYTRIAGRLPLHASSSGLVLLAHSALEVQDRILRSELHAYTDKTIRTSRQLRTALAEVRRQDFAFCAGHIYPETTGIAVPVRDSNVVVAAVALVVPNDDQARTWIPALQAAARGITRVMATISFPRSEYEHKYSLND
ncbi:MULTISPECIES: IclR family transcriptional regulator [Rhodococcus]|uniref:IclR family transcriptional regulator n=1 Tax=Rhodococcus qingshengii TaxID=334542 RepID=A0A2A5JA65_RHOSG|nr:MULTISPECIES: IclR family transcriptional regulator [Rhodococcus]MDJ0105169.1 IclR family transcriptional regulator [Rhodococcus erythropolis]MDV8013883.1 IclR family transcriptional regulator [Rhodococcus sp. IEGM 1241]PCK26480.1 IclR family transcriptional regulator [Rhodococcus qingshengii]